VAEFIEIEKRQRVELFELGGVPREGSPYPQFKNKATY
jgi:hypothetical protein